MEGDAFRLMVAPLRASARDRALDLFREERRHISGLIRRSSGEVVHAHWTYEFAWAAQRTGRPLLVTAHDAPLSILRYLPDAYRLARTLMAYRVRLALGTLTAVSPYLAAQWRRQMLYRGEIEVIPNIAPFFEGRIRDASTGSSAPLRSKGGHRLLLDIADAGPRKNLPILIDAFRSLAGQHDDLRLALIGHGLDHGGELARRPRQRSDDRIDFCGVLDRPAVREKLRAAAVLRAPGAGGVLPDGRPRGDGFRGACRRRSRSGRHALGAWRCRGPRRRERSLVCRTRCRAGSRRSSICR